ncbi:MAG: LCP family protein [Candidatus Kerfeldbacteria bacterium]|nr:LCP family protein [Candidatus Kerfeldbacteria bacterium]
MSLHPKPTANVRTSTNVVTAADQPPERLGCRRWLRRLFVRGSLITLVILILLGVGFYLSQPKFYHILVIGSDQRNDEHARSDALMVVSIPKSTQDPLSLTMVPRDTKIDHAEKGLQKITHFYAMWDDTVDRMGNVELTQSVVEDLLDIKIHGTVEVTFDSFTDIVDTVGGVDISTGHVDGAEAQELVHNRFVQAEGDFGRAAEQREIFKAVLDKAKSPLVARKIYDYLQTSERARLRLSIPSLVSFGITYVIGHRGITVPAMEEVVLPGEGQRIYTPSFGKSLYYWVLDEDATNALVEKYLR